jgi:nucleoside-diphosphate kinase
MKKTEQDQTLVLIKPDALKNSLTGYILSQLSEFHTGLRFAGMKIVNVNKMLAEEHYEEHRGKPFFPALLNYITGLVHYPKEPWRQRVIAIIYQGQDAVKKIRALAGPTNPDNAREQRPGCIRALGTVVDIKNEQGKIIGDRLDNLIHASAIDSEAEREIKLWFMPEDIPAAMRVYQTGSSDKTYYYRDGRITSSYENGATSILAQGEIAWKTDIDALKLLSQGKTASVPLNTVIAKYFINL